MKVRSMNTKLRRLQVSVRPPENASYFCSRRPPARISTTTAKLFTGGYPFSLIGSEGKHISPGNKKILRQSASLVTVSKAFTAFMDNGSRNDSAKDLISRFSVDGNNNNKCRRRPRESLVNIR